jgi:hypothetical protein
MACDPVEARPVKEKLVLGSSAPAVIAAVTGCLRLSVGVLFLWAGLAKLHDPYAFLSAVYSYELLGPESGLWLARMLPWAELGVGVCPVGRRMARRSLVHFDRAAYYLYARAFFGSVSIIADSMWLC